MAEVYRAFHPNLNRHVAIKILHPHLADAPDFIGRFRREAQAVAQLHHPNIVQVFDFDAEGDLQYMVMECVAGQALKARLDDLYLRGERLPLDEILRLFRALLDAVGYAHAVGMVHRDLKPANVMLEEKASAVNGQPSAARPVLMDFGIAKILGAQKFTASGITVGTPTYMSPEQGQGAPGDERSDLYALGVMLYECLTGQAPYEGDTSIAVMLKHISAPIPALRQVRPDLPAALESVVNQALAKNPADRFQSANEFWEAMAAIESLSDQPTAAAPVMTATRRAPSPAIEETRPALRWTRPAALAGVAVGLLLLAAFVFLPGLRGPTPAARAIAQGQALLASGSHQLAADAFTTALAAEPENIDALLGRAKAYEALGQSDAALPDIERVIALAPERPVGYVERARLTLQYFSADPATALADLDRAVQLATGAEAAHAHYWRGWAILNFPLIEGAPNPAAALDNLQQAATLDANNVEAQVALAQALLALGQPGAALDPINRAIELQPDAALNYRLRAHINFSLPDAVEAKEDLSAAIQRETDAAALATLYAERAYLALQAGQTDEARADVAQAFAHDSESLLARLVQALLDPAQAPLTAEQRAVARDTAPADDPIWQAILAGP